MKRCYSTLFIRPEKFNKKFCDNMFIASKGKTVKEETREKLRKTNIGNRFINNGIKTIVIKENETLPKGWEYGRCKKK